MKHWVRKSFLHVCKISGYWFLYISKICNMRFFMFIFEQDVVFFFVLIISFWFVCLSTMLINSSKGTQKKDFVRNESGAGSDGYQIIY